MSKNSRDTKKKHQPVFRSTVGCVPGVIGQTQGHRHFLETSDVLELLIEMMMSVDRAGSHWV